MMARIKAWLGGLKRWVLWLVLGIVVIVVIALILFWRATIAPTPTAFYTPPDPLPAGDPGTIIRSEPITSSLPEGAVAWRVLYLSTGVNGEPVAVSGVVVAPEGESASPRPVVAFAQGTVGVVPECGTSHTRDPFQQIPEVELLVREGFVVAATDYPGRGTPGIHPYLIGPVEASSVLDSVRAARQLDVNAGDQFVVWGRSQGGHASLWTAQLAGEYAPELTLIGAVASAPAIDLAGIFESGLEKRVGAIVISQALYAWGHLYPDVNLDDLIKPELRTQFENIATTCLTTPAAFLLVGAIPTPSEFLMVDPLTAEPYSTLIADNTPRGPINVPLLISHGIPDSLIPIEGSVADAARRCAEGENVQLVRYPGVEHDAAAQSALMTLGWIEDRFAGRPTGSNCDD
jgi:alpha-beta hydrolase superfamily lysophospholipase